MKWIAYIQKFAKFDATIVPRYYDLFNIQMNNLRKNIVAYLPCVYRYIQVQIVFSYIT